MKKILIVISAVSLSGCILTNEADPWYEYVPVSNEDPINKSWFKETLNGINRSSFEIIEAQEELKDLNKTWSTSIPWVLKLEVVYTLCLDNTSSYNYQAEDFDQAQFDVWELPKYVPYEGCY